MKKRQHRSRPSPATAPSLPRMLGEMALASVETIARRTRMIADGTCSPTEYRRMVAEKAQAAQDSAGVLARLRIENIASGRGAAKTLRAILDPWHSRVTANARRLRKT